MGCKLISLHPFFMNTRFLIKGRKIDVKKHSFLNEGILMFAIKKISYFYQSICCLFILGYKQFRIIYLHQKKLK
jgi:hypothetical protein